MNFWKNFFFRFTVSANILLTFLLIFYDRLTVPAWLQVFGRMHPLFLHFPIVLLIVYILWVLLAGQLNITSKELIPGISKFLLLIVALSCVITALMGLFLSREAGYNPESLVSHKWTGVMISWITCIWLYAFDFFNSRANLTTVMGLASLVFVVLAGHFGSDITHGDNFLLAPIIKDNKQKKPLFDDAVVYTDMVHPILASKCLSCHNNKKAKGELVMETEQTLLKGGKDGPLWDTTKENLGLIFERIHLPVEDKKHMAPDGKPQLTDQEIAILYNWVKEGADFKVRVNELAETDTLRTIASNMFKSVDEEEVFDFSPAKEAVIADLNTNYCTVYALSKESPALVVDFYGAAFFKSEELKNLLKIKQQVVSLNLDKMPVTDDDLKTVGQFVNLRYLNLSFSKITGAGLSYLAPLVHLKTITLSNTNVQLSDVEKLASLKELHRINAWNTPVAAAGVKSIKQFPNVKIETGLRIDTMHFRLNPPILQNEEVVIDTPITLKLKHYVPGITIRYTTDSTEPDSSSPVYAKNSVKLSNQLLLRAKAFKPGWLPSDDLKFQFYHSTYRPDTIILLQRPDSAFMAKGSKTLYNNIKGDMETGNGKWLGFHKNPMECLMYFSRPVPVHVVGISSQTDRGNQTFPPTKLELWGGNDPASLKLLGTMVPPQPDTLKPATLSLLTLYEFKMKPVKMKYLRIKATPVAVLPKDLIDPKDKIKRGWFFIDEIFVN